MHRQLGKGGGIMADRRTGEGFCLAAGNSLSCMPDALYNGMGVFYRSGTIPAAEMVPLSLARIRSATIPQLGNVSEGRCVSWLDLMRALLDLQLPFELRDVNQEFANQKGGTFWNLLRTTSRVFLVTLHIRVTTVSIHCIMVSTIPRSDGLLGIIIDNQPKVKPVYIEVQDKRRTSEAHATLHDKLLNQNPFLCDRKFTSTVIHVFELLVTNT